MHLVELRQLHRCQRLIHLSFEFQAPSNIYGDGVGDKQHLSDLQYELLDQFGVFRGTGVTYACSGMVNDRDQSGLLHHLNHPLMWIRTETIRLTRFLRNMMFLIQFIPTNCNSKAKLKDDEWEMSFLNMVYWRNEKYSQMLRYFYMVPQVYFEVGFGNFYKFDAEPNRSLLELYFVTVYNQGLHLFHLSYVGYTAKSHVSEDARVEAMINIYSSLRHNLEGEPEIQSPDQDCHSLIFSPLQIGMFHRLMGAVSFYLGNSDFTYFEKAKMHFEISQRSLQNHNPKLKDHLQPFLELTNTCSDRGKWEEEVIHPLCGIFEFLSVQASDIARNVC